MSSLKPDTPHIDGPRRTRRSPDHKVRLVEFPGREMFSMLFSIVMASATEVFKTDTTIHIGLTSACINGERMTNTFAPLEEALGKRGTTIQETVVTVLGGEVGGPDKVESEQCGKYGKSSIGSLLVTLKDYFGRKTANYPKNLEEQKIMGTRLSQWVIDVLIPLIKQGWNHIVLPCQMNAHGSVEAWGTRASPIAFSLASGIMLTILETLRLVGTVKVYDLSDPAQMDAYVESAIANAAIYNESIAVPVVTPTVVTPTVVTPTVVTLPPGVFPGSWYTGYSLDQNGMYVPIGVYSFKSSGGCVDGEGKLYLRGSLPEMVYAFNGCTSDGKSFDYFSEIGMLYVNHELVSDISQSDYTVVMDDTGYVTVSKICPCGVSGCIMQRQSNGLMTGYHPKTKGHLY
jgi:hypothetical protein